MPLRDHGSRSRLGPPPGGLLLAPLNREAQSLASRASRTSSPQILPCREQETPSKISSVFCKPVTEAIAQHFAPFHREEPPLLPAPAHPPGGSQGELGGEPPGAGRKPPVTGQNKTCLRSLIPGASLVGHLNIESYRKPKFHKNLMSDFKS